MNFSKVLIFAFSIIILLSSISTPVRADCVNPAGSEGDQVYNGDYKTMQFCDGTNWWGMKSGVPYFSGQDGEIAYLSGSQLAFSSGITFTSAANVGIGGVTAAHDLHIYRPSGTASTTLKVENNEPAGQASIHIDNEGSGSSNSSIFFEESGTAQAAMLWRSDSNILDFRTGGAAQANARMVIDNDGDVGIGTTSPGQKLTVAGTVESTSGGFKFPDGTTQTTAASGGGGVPSGAVMAFNLASCPTGWSALAGAAGRVVMGVGTLGADSYALNDTGGSARHTLTISEMPSHSHSYVYRNTQDTGSSGGSTVKPIASTTGGTTGSNGGNSAHENRPPYLALLYCEKD